MKLIYKILTCYQLSFLTMHSYPNINTNLKYYPDNCSNIITNRILSQNYGEEYLNADEYIYPELNMNVSEIIRYNGYPCEDHTVVTEDGYILSIQRIPHGRNEKLSSRRVTKPVVYLQHGLLCSSSVWVINSINQSLGFMLADQGFDVWMGNSRGNTYSNRHLNYSQNQTIFWEWSWDHMALYDIPSTIHYIIKITQQTGLYYVGHSQGTLIAFSSISQPHSNKTPSNLNSDVGIGPYIKALIALSPVAFLGHIRGPLRELALLPVSQEILEISLGHHKDFLPKNHIVEWLNKIFCERKGLNLLCSNLLFLICGPDPTNLNLTRLPVYFTHYPSGTSVQNIVHYIQAIKSQKFQKYDYGVKVNQKIYNQTKPPEYEVSKLKNIPIHLFVGLKDWLATDIDVLRLKEEIGEVKTYIYPTYNHLDFMWGENANTLVYDKIIKIFKNDNI